MGVLNIAVLCTMILVFTSGVCNGHPHECPAFWSRFRDNCYRFFGRPKTWRESEAFCNNFSPSTHSNSTRIAHLVSIDNKDENDFVSRFWDAARTDGEDDVFLWLGLQKETSFSDKETFFKWVDNGEPHYTNWDYDRPNNYGGQEDCTEMWELHQTTGPHKPMSWNDVLCHSLRPFMCKMQV